MSAEARNKIAALAALFIILTLLVSSSYAASDAEDSSDGPLDAIDAPWLGIVVQDIDDSMATALGLGEVRGVLVSEISEGGPADEAGLNTGDVILKFGGRDIAGAEELISGVKEFRAGSPVVLEVNRAGEVDRVNVILGVRPRKACAGFDDYGETYWTGHSKHPFYGDCRRAGRRCRGGDCWITGGTAHFRRPWSLGRHGTEEMESEKYDKILSMATESLGLDAEQMKKAASLRSEYRKKAIKTTAEIKVAEVELKEFKSGDTVNLDKVKAKINEISAKKAEVRFLRAKGIEDFKKILNEDQLKKFKNIAAGSDYAYFGHYWMIDDGQGTDEE